MDDLISRQAAIDALDCINGAEEVLRSIPSAQPTIEPRAKGHWIDGFKRQWCSNCRYPGFKSWSFCPNCGADMREVNNG